MESQIFAAEALLPSGWAQDVTISIDATGQITAIDVNSQPGGTPRAAGPLLIESAPGSAMACDTAWYSARSAETSPIPATTASNTESSGSKGGSCGT